MGTLEGSHSWSPVVVVDPETEAELLLERPGLLAEIGRKPRAEDNQLLYESLMVEKDLGVAGSPVAMRSLDERYGPCKHMPTLCSCHTQACRKTRRIDNAKRAGKNRQTNMSERLTLTNALMPAPMLKAIYSIAAPLGP